MTPTETRVEWRNVYEGTDWTITCATREEADKYGDGLWLGTRLAPRIAVERIETTTTITRIPVREEQAGMSERTMLDGLPLCARCGLLAADHVVMVTACDGFVTAPSEDFAKTPDAVGVARLVAEMAKQASLGHKRFCVGIHDHGELGVEEEWEDWSATFARFESRVRAECAAKVRGFADAYPTDVWPETPFSDAQAASVMRLMVPRILAALDDPVSHDLTRDAEAAERLLTECLANGALFNPEAMDPLAISAVLVTGRDAIAALRRQVETLTKQYADAVNSGVEIATELATLRAKAEQTQARFRRYADHDEGCASYGDNPEPCDCGFPDAWYATFPDEAPTAYAHARAAQERADAD